MKPEALNVIKMLSKPIADRMPFEGVELTKFIQKIPFFKQFFPVHSENFVTMCLSCELIRFKAGQKIYSKEVHPSFIYIVIDGSVEIQQKRSDSSTLYPPRQITGYNMMGHVQVIFSLENRGEVATATSDLYCMVISSEKFGSVWEKDEQVRKTHHYLRKNSYFDDLQAFDIQQLALMMHKKNFTAGEIICRENQPNENILFIAYGQIQAIKKLTVDEKDRDVVIQVLEQMSSYGEYETCENMNNQISLSAATSGMFYCLTMKEAIEANNNFYELIKKKYLPYPDKEQLQFRLGIQNQIEREKNRVKRKLFSHFCQ